MANFVLMHGGGMGGWVWKYIARALRDRGHDVFTPTFTGFGERIHLIGRDVANATHVNDIVNVLEFEDISDCVLVAHSYSGSVVPGVYAQVPERIRKIVYFDAILTESGESIVEAMEYMDRDSAAAAAVQLAQGEGPVGSGVDVMQRQVIAADPLWVSAELQTWILDHLSDMPLACTVTPVAIGAETLPKTVSYVAASHSVMTRMRSRAADLGWTVHDLEGDHMFMIGQPDWTVRYLLDQAA